jgi:hypothetical protein
MRENRPSGSEGGVALIPPSLPLSCAAATPHGASELAKRLQCAGLLALSKSDTQPRELPQHPRFPQATGWVARPRTLPSRGPGFHPGPMATTRCRARFHLGHLTQRRQGSAAPALPRPWTAPPRSRSIWSALACGRCRRETLRPKTNRPTPILQACSTPDPIDSSPEGLYPPMARFHPGPGVGCTRTRRQPPEDNKPPPAELFPPQPPRWPVAGRKPRLAPRVGRFSSKGCSSGFE